MAWKLEKKFIDCHLSGFIMVTINHWI